MSIFCKKQYDYPAMPPELDLRIRLPFDKLPKMRVLNVGAGSGYSSLALQLPFLKFKQFDCIDIHEPYLAAARAREYQAKRTLFIKLDVRKMIFDKYDLVMMFDILEHLPKVESLLLMSKIKCRQVIFIPLEKHFRENSFGVKSQDHLSLWTEDDFKKLGYKTEVLYNFHKEGDDVFDALWAIK